MPTDYDLMFKDVQLRNNSLPTADPLIAGAEWNNGGIVTVSTGS
jgi:hypothetical protein